MKLSKTAIIALIAVPVLAAVIALAVYLLYGRLQQQQEANDEILHKFGFTISPTSPYTESTGVLGGKQLPATFAEEELTPVERVLQGLIRDRDQLIEENGTLQQRVDELQREVESLQQYKTRSNHFAPANFDQELQQVRSTLASLLRDLPEAQRFGRLRLEMMTEAGVREYRRYVEGNQMMLSDQQREEILADPLLTYSFCIGNAIDLAANSAAEERVIAAWLQAPADNPLPTQIRRDLEVVIPPCQQALRSKLPQPISGMSSGG